MLTTFYPKLHCRIERDQCQTNIQISFYSSSFHGWCVFSVRISWVNYDISCCCSVAKACPTLCNPMDCSTLGSPFLHNLLEFSDSCSLNWWCYITSHPLPPLLLLPSIFPSIKVFSNQWALLIKWALHIKWPKYWSFNFRISSSIEYSGLISFRTVWFDLLADQRTFQESSPEPQFKSMNLRHSAFFMIQFSHLYVTLGKTIRGFPGGSDCKRVCLQCGRPGCGPWVRKIPWRRKWQPTPILLPGKFLDGGAW